MVRPGVRPGGFVFGDCGSDAGSRPENYRIGSLLLHHRRIRGRPLRKRRKENQTTSAAAATADPRLMDNIIDDIPCDPCGSDGEANFVEVPQSTQSFPMELGMEFETEEHAVTYYNNYAGSSGFSTRKGYVNRKNKEKSSYITSRKIYCSKEGYRGKDKRDPFVKKPRKDTRTGCLAHVVFTRDRSNGKYRVTSFDAEHNHPLAPKGTEHLLPSQRKIKKVHEHGVGLEDDSGMHPKSSHKFMARQAGDQAYLGRTADKDPRNYLCTKRQRHMKLGEAGNLLHYFEKRKLDDPSFFLALQLDVNDSITNVFWADAQMIVDHRIFGDVMSFEMTCKSCSDYRPFALFAGMNHYRKMVVFGAAFMYDETTDSFKWLFETFLKAMSGRKPKTIVTDQDAAIGEAISIVMPDTYHRFCVWHMGQNALKHLNYVFRGSDSFGKDFYKFIYEFEDEREFLDAWQVMLDKYDLKDNDWLRGIFALRVKWAMVYGRNMFSAGMRSTQLSKRFNAALKDYLKSDLDLVQFFEHFEMAIDDKRYKELEASYDMTQRIPRLKMHLPLLIHARDIYTSVIFEMFQDEWAKSLLVVVNSCMEDGPCYIYNVCTTTHTREHTVVAKPSDVVVSCSCKKFEYLGILCSHALKILDMMNVKMMIPGHYILKRWTKDARVGSVEVGHGGGTDEDPVLKVTNRYRILHPTFAQIAATASKSKAGFELATKYANELVSKLETICNADNPKVAPSTTLEGLESGHNQINAAANLFE